MIRLTAAVIVACLILAVGCSIGTPDMDKAAKRVEDSSKNLQAGMTAAAKSLQTGIEKFDAIGLRDLLNKNDALRQSVEALQATLAVAPTGSGVISLEGRSLQLTISQYRGGFKIQGYLDTEENAFWVDKVLTRNDLKLGYDFEDFFRNAAANVKGTDAFSNAIRKSFMDMSKDVRRSKAKEIANAGSEAAFQAFLKSPGFIPRAEDATIDLNSQLGSGSLHKLVILITPMELDANGKWSLRGRAILKSGSSVETLKEFDVGSDLTPVHKIGESLPPVRLLLMVKKSANES